MRFILILLITLYQRWISPRKGFRCAHAAHFGGPSCSQAVKSIIDGQGLFRGWPLIRLRFAECRAAYRTLQGEDADGVRKKRRHRNDEDSCFNDFDPDDSDLCCIAESGCDALDCATNLHSRER